MKEYLYHDLSEKIIGIAIEVHKELGPGLLENSYKQCFAYELNKANFAFNLEVNLPLKYKDIIIATAYRIDLIVENKIILELKTVEKILPIHEAQLLTYMKLSNIELGLIINYNEIFLRDGIRRLVLQNKKNK